MRTLSTTLAVLFTVIAGAACNALPIVGGDDFAAATQDPTKPSPTRAVDGDGPFLYTDPPLPTYSEKTARPRPTHAAFEIPDCLDWVVQVDMYPGNEALVRESSVVVIGTFDFYGKARWNTASGKRPSTEEYLESSYRVTIVRDVRVVAEDLLRGGEPDLAGAYFRGGQIGCDSVSYSNMPELKSGNSAAFFFGAFPIAGPDSGAQLRLIRVWPIDEHGRVESDSGPSMMVAELRDLVETTPYTPD